MPGIDEQVQELLSRCPILTDESFNERYPGIGNVASFLDSVTDVSPEPYIRINAADTKSFLDLLQKGDEKAVKLYQNIKRIWRF